MEPSKYQQAIFDTLSSTNNIMVQAVAGSGKTKTIELASKKLPGRLLYLVFNKRNQEEAAVKMPNVEVRTFNSFGNSLVTAQLGYAKLDAYKSVNIFTKLFGDDNKASAFVCARLVSLLKSYAYGCDDADSSILDFLVDRFDIEMPKKLTYSMVMDVFNRGLVWPVRDFDDQIYLPIKNMLAMPKYDTIFIDECQDLNPIKIKMVSELAKHSRIIAVGDCNQAIYGFAGADTKSMATLKGVLNPLELPLSVNYRCGKNIVLEAKKIVPQIEPWENSPDGMISETRACDAGFEYQVDDMVLCRCTAPLVSECLGCIKKGIRATILGREIGESLIKLANEVRDIAGLQGWYGREMDKAAKTNRNTINISDKYETMLVLFGEYGSVVEVVQAIKNIFSEDRKGITFSTIHKSKGLESDRVLILKPELLPHPNAKQDWQLEQEHNLKYVAITRARKELIWVRSK